MLYRKSRVSFNKETHEYALGDKRLIGYTSSIGAWMYPDTYAGAPAATLAAAAARGTARHTAMRLAFSLDASCGVPEVDAGAAMLRGAGLKPEAWEWLVDDGRHFASAVDIVFTDGSICDIKTTAKYHEAEVMLQLGFYAYLLEKMNRGVAVPALWCLWIPRPKYGAPALMRVPRIPYKSVARIVRGYLRGDAAEAHRGDATPPMPTGWNSLARRWADTVRRMEKMAAAEREMRARLLATFTEKGFQRYDDARIRITRVPSHTRETVDTERLRTDYPEAYQTCRRATDVPAAIRIKAKDSGDDDDVFNFL